MYNKKDIARMEVELKESIGGPNYDTLLQDYTGPGVGLIWDEDTGKLRLADGWIFDDNGDIVEKDAVTGPGAQ